MIIINPYIFGGGGLPTPGTTNPVFNPADKHADVALSAGDTSMTTTGGAAWVAVRTTTSRATGTGFDYYLATLIGGSDVHEIVGLGTSAAALTLPGIDGFGIGYYGSTGQKYQSGTPSAYGATFGPGDRIDILITSAGDVTFYKNGVSQGVAFMGLSGTYFGLCGVATSASNITLTPRQYTPIGSTLDWV